ncbi:MAG: hypothetical protein HRU19_32945 [Pseudobacteriovorax sp.]|nr:hypothetical protein [Pseudobacteriovorax sp.]
MKIALLTYEEKPDLSPQEKPFIDIFRSKAVEAVTVVWSDKTVDWSSFDIVIPKACWDYYLFPQQFLSFLSLLDQKGIKLINPLPSIVWNHKKSYLKDLQAKGVEIADFEIIRSVNQFEGILQEKNWSDVIIKPMISGASYLTESYRSNDTDAAKTHLAKVLEHSEAIIQPLFPEIPSQGEISMMFFGGKFSHAVLKTPLQGDFRSQPQFGSKVMDYEPSENVIREAHRTLTLAPSELAYARVDGFLRDDRFLLMELELIEPFLFTDEEPGVKHQTFVESVLAFANR